MGLRFRKTVSLGKGVRLNFSKSGVSTTLGPRGASVSIGKRGTYANIGIPGTGLSYRKRLDTPQSQKPGASSKGGLTQAQQRTLNEIASYTGNRDFSFTVDVDDSGVVIFRDAAGQEITDSHLISLLKKHPVYKENKADIDAEVAQRQKEWAERLHAATDEFLNIHRLSPAIETDSDFKVARGRVRRRQFEPVPFTRAKPEKDSIRRRLEQEAEGRVSAKTPWGRKKAISDYVDSNLEQAYAAEMSSWDSARQQHDRDQQAARSAFEQKAERHYKKQLRRIDAALDGNPSYIEWAVGKWFSKCELPFEVSADYDYDPASRCLSIDLDLPEIEDLPKTDSVQLASGKYKEKDKSQKRLKEEYLRCVLGLVVFVAANMLNVSPRIECVTVSGYTQRRDSAGAIADEYIVSVRFLRDKLRALRVSEMEPMDVVLSFENRLNVTQGMLMKAIQPL